MPPTAAPTTNPLTGTSLRRRDLRRLPGRASWLNPFGSHRLWLAADFLLQLNGGFCTQEFRRFAYRDIQALEICGSGRWLVYNLLLGVPMLVLTLLAALDFEKNVRWGLGIVAGGFLVLLLLNLARGPTCRCVLQTALGPQLLPSLGRQRAAREAVALITARVQAAQPEE